jgi:hypothetical protein
MLSYAPRSSSLSLKFSVLSLQFSVFSIQSQLSVTVFGYQSDFDKNSVKLCAFLVKLGVTIQ